MYSRVLASTGTLRAGDGSRSAIDNFILAKLQEKKLTPSPPADKVTLIRRASFDLIGLPPSTKEVDDFLADTSTNAFATVVDRLLDSPHYGERWARYWLDLAHFADTKGAVGNNTDPRYLYAYTYRDYVIRAFNEDLPYDQFLLQQIAADKLPLGGDQRPLAALGFLTLGNRFNNQINDIIDDRIDLLCKSTMGLTVNCARCHDHKFDPIPTKDYYALHGVFNSCTEPREGPLLEPPKDTPAYRDFQKQLAAREGAVEKFHEKAAQRIEAEIRGNAGKYLLALHEWKQATNGIARDAFIQRKGLSRQLAAAWDNSLHNWSRKHHPVFAPWFAFAEVPPAEFNQKAAELASRFYANQDSHKPINPLVARMFVNAPASLSQVAARYSSMFADVDKRWQSEWNIYVARKKNADAALRRADIPVRSNDQNSSAPEKGPGAPVPPDPAADKNVRAPAEPKGLSDPASEEIRQLLYAKNSPTYLDEQRINNLINQDNKARDQLNNLRRAVNDLKMSHPGSPARAHVLEDAPQPKNSHVFIHGNPGSKGPTVPRHFLVILAGKSPPPFTDGSGRLELAQAIASRDNPLTARVLVNRVWLHHFGEGLVRTPDDFGTRSEPPTHPELLDYLAWQFMEDGWSLKKLHRRIMLSAVYQQSSDDNPRYAQIDPDNRFLWQMNRRRLDFEALRDTVLAIGGKLDLTLGGPSVQLTAEPYSTRRSIYGFIDRNRMANLYLAFDFANPDLTTGRRDNTIVPQQALFMMNSPLVVEQARALVRREDFRTQTKEEDRLRLLYKLIYQRAPTSVETKLALDYLHSDTETAHLQPGKSPWEYGYGEFDAATRRLKQFILMSSYAGNAWQPGSRAANSQLANVSLTADGGMPGRQYAAIRRWTAPRDGFIAIDGILRHGANEGDGVLGRIVSSRSGLLTNLVCFKAQVPTKIPKLLVKRGETIDFVVECRTNPRGDGFAWAPTIKMSHSSLRPDPAEVSEWDARKEFSGPETREALDRLGPWEKFAQVLLETNELTFVN